MNLLNGFEQIQNVIPETTKWKASRAKAFQDFQKLGLPTRKNEEWKYLNVQPLADIHLKPSLISENKGSLQTESEIASTLNSDFYHLVFINGFLNQTLSNIRALKKEIELFTMPDVIAGKDLSGEMLAHEFEILSRVHCQGSNSAFDRLNQSFLGQGVILRIKADTKPSKPIQIHSYISLEGGLPLATHLENFVIIETGAKASIVESFSGKESEKYFANNNTNILIRKNASLEYVRLQEESQEAFHIGRTRVYLNESTNLHSASFQVGGKIGRHNLDIYHLEKYSTSIVDGAYLCDQERVLDNHTLIDHVVGDCQSSQLYKGIVSQKSKAIFNGKVMIRHGALKASSEQLNKNLLLSSEAEVDSKPELAIYADDVKATHGSTIGQLNEEEIFYFESRCISRAKAIELLSQGFVFELVHKIENKEVANWLGNKLSEKMRQQNV